MFALRQISRSSNVFRNRTRLPLNTNNVRHGGNWSYRNTSPPSESSVGNKFANVIFFATWYWILYNCFTQYEHLIGHFPYIKPKNWTDEELGIPPDEE